MGKQILFCWLGATDLKASGGTEDVGLGPVAQALKAKDYSEVVLLNNWDDSRASAYCAWLVEITSANVSLEAVPLTSPTHFGQIYQGASKVIAKKLKQYGEDSELTFHLSPGTPAMAAVWILLAKARFQAELIESSRDRGVSSVDVPFDISADFIPEIFRNTDRTLEILASGLPASAPEFKDIIHRSEVMQRIVLKARLIASRSVAVLIEGESGTGKELFARAIHDASPRKGNPFVAINCGAIPTELVESELFGHEKGAFTGASATRIGHFEAAHTGTVFLDEIGELPKEMQVKLLRTLQGNEIKRVGATVAKTIDVRIIAATNRNLIDEVSTGSFREDLFYRLAVAVIKLPPLREREGDVSLLIDRFMRQFDADSDHDLGCGHKKISVTARNVLMRHIWPGNVRELQNTLIRAAIWSLGDEISELDVREALLPIPMGNKGSDVVLNRPITQGFNLPELMKMVAVHYLERGMQQCRGNKTNASKLLGLASYQTLTNWLKKYGLE